jgi:hypothetical protein
MLSTETGDTTHSTGGTVQSRTRRKRILRKERREADRQCTNSECTNSGRDGLATQSSGNQTVIGEQLSETLLDSSIVNTEGVSQEPEFTDLEEEKDEEEGVQVSMNMPGDTVKSSALKSEKPKWKRVSLEGNYYAQFSYEDSKTSSGALGGGQSVIEIGRCSDVEVGRRDIGTAPTGTLPEFRQHMNTKQKRHGGQLV